MLTCSRKPEYAVLAGGGGGGDGAALMQTSTRVQTRQILTSIEAVQIVDPLCWLVNSCAQASGVSLLKFQGTPSRKGPNRSHRIAVAIVVISPTPQRCHKLSGTRQRRLRVH